ncbi:hypothetical protein [Agrococcus sp. Marseille-Q4369]|uniref:hypothetical protein n=1 Tax=Agrococcus sp. Marseille-Q4369 TaxID=2810513 RepID=UPI001B8D5C47|nr:hypothetical protein [Agrococcus sp. Marseille-Q4369]QUW17764.1 hypothetical protein JSQ78_07715 [Agrococcus sp. Marseille-Q4369]
MADAIGRNARKIAASSLRAKTSAASRPAARLALFLEASRDERLRSASEGIVLHRIAHHDERDPRPLLEAVVRGALAAPDTHPAALTAAPEQST